MPAKSTSSILQIDELKQGRVTLRLVGNTPLYYNAMSVKAKRSLLIGGGKKTAAEKKDIKHNPEEEFRDSVYKGPDGPTLLRFPAPGIKGAMATAALETAGVNKTSVKRLIFMPQPYVPIWGKPFLKMDVVRSADMNRTPDVRTRAFLPQWCAEVDIAFVEPTLNLQSVVSLLSNAGVVVGIGDFRQEKGAGSHGTFSVTGSQDMGSFQDAWDRITEEARDVQVEAMANPTPYDEDTEELFDMLVEERNQRAGGSSVVSSIAAE